MTAPELKPCPWCGEKGALEVHRGHFNSYVECKNCAAYGPNEPDSKTFANWNTRALIEKEGK